MPSFSAIAASAAALACVASLIACKPAATIQQHVGSTGVCYSHLSTLSEGKVVSFHQVVLVRSSGDMSKDIRRINSVSADRFTFQNPDTIPNVWLSAWLDDQRVYATSGPDCSALPMAKH